MVKDEVTRIKEEGLLVPAVQEEGAVEGQEGLVWEKGKVDVGRVQRFWWTAPPEGHPGGNDGKSLFHKLSLERLVDNCANERACSCMVYKSADRGVLRNVGCPEQDQPSGEQIIKI